MELWRCYFFWGRAHHTPSPSLHFQHFLSTGWRSRWISNLVTAIGIAALPPFINSEEAPLFFKKKQKTKTKTGWHVQGNKRNIDWSGIFFLRKHFLKSAVCPVCSLSVHTPSYNYIVTWRVPCSGVVLCFAYKTGEGAEQLSVRSVVYVQRSAAPSSGENNRSYRLQFLAKEVRRCFSWWGVLFTLNQKSRVVIYHLKYTAILIRHSIFVSL